LADSELQRSPTEPALGRNSEQIGPPDRLDLVVASMRGDSAVRKLLERAARNRLELALAYMRGGPAARRFLERALNPKLIRIKPATDDDPHSGSSEQRPPRRPTFSSSRDAGRLVVQSARSLFFADLAMATARSCVGFRRARCIQGARKADHRDCEKNPDNGGKLPMLDGTMIRRDDLGKMAEERHVAHRAREAPTARGIEALSA
jgi:hypothetical protein